MATSREMMLAGIAFTVDTFVLVVSAIWGSAVFKPLLSWYYSVPYAKPPPLDPGMVTIIPPLYFSLLLVIWFALLAAIVYMVMNRQVYPYGSS